MIALHKLNPDAEVHVVLTGRPVRFGATKEHATWEWDPKDSRMAQEASAMRIKNFLRHFGVTVTRVFDGGIAPRTLVPHWVHFAEYYKFFDVDPLQAIRHSELEPQEELVKILLKLPAGSVPVAVGGPMTGLYQLIVRCPEVVSRFKELHAMFATWGNVALMQFKDTYDMNQLNQTKAALPHTSLPGGRFYLGKVRTPKITAHGRFPHEDWDILFNPQTGAIDVCFYGCNGTYFHGAEAADGSTNLHSELDKVYRQLREGTYEFPEATKDDGLWEWNWH